MDKLLKQAKKFIAKKSCSRVMLRTVLVDEQYIIATDSYHLIRVKHHEKIEAPYLVKFNEKDTELEAQYYPELSEFIPSTDGVVQVPIHLKYWIDVHTQALVVAKVGKNNTVTLLGETLVAKSIDKNGNELKYEHEFLSSNLQNITRTGYNCKLMLNALKVFKTLKEEPVLHWYGSLRPLVLKSENIEVLIVPIKLGSD